MKPAEERMKTAKWMILKIQNVPAYRYDEAQAYDTMRDATSAACGIVRKHGPGSTSPFVADPQWGEVGQVDEDGDVIGESIRDVEFRPY